MEDDVATKQTRPSRRAHHPLIIVGNAIFTLLLVAIVVGGGAFWVVKSSFDSPGPLPADTNVVIPNQSGVMDIAELLEQKGVISDRYIFVAGAFGERATGKLKAGEYAFAKAATPQQVLDTIVSGKVVEYDVTIPEGLTSDQIVERLNESPVLTGTVRQPPREGSLLPETYKVTRGTTREELLKRMAREQQRALKEIWDARSPNLPLKSPDELVVLASIVEKETGIASERPQVAAVFVNRLTKKMRLQSDPTIIYGIVRGKGKLDRPITKADILAPTPFNTYAIDGLPPGPIGNPGKASLEAVANPAPIKAVYFVADGSGGHVFAESLNEHNKNVAKWRQLEQKQKQDSATTPAGAAGTTGATPSTVSPSQ
ncbi:endolytic transglycosylase MltG [Ancylobacter sp. 6x-1]|uniref:Endolytic murein transglycosylase n=1 Tax=Ancylobacter crimeensis TaxID=2579147 RepID=A0ABT0D641_9HYPH|nr:endolytic transglycosylase MltG [Ancylobacter crimeensis]MCK0195421.1 endolytic transglycosylase MltG [Ancylobacter crimeensis]